MTDGINKETENKDEETPNIGASISEETQILANQAEEMSLLKKRAEMLQLKYHPNIGLDKLRLKVKNVLEGIDDGQTAATQTPVQAHIEENKNKAPLSRNEINAKHRQEASKLIRIRVACMDPNKKEYEGEIFTVSNAVVGTHKKFVSYNNDAGWHVPNIIYQHLLQQQCQIFYTVKGPRGNKIRKGKLIKAFAIEVMPPLTGVELDELAQRQAMANNLD